MQLRSLIILGLGRSNHLPSTQRVGTMVQPGDSAIFALLRSIELVAAQFKGYAGTILRTTLSPEQREKVEATLHAR
jgi:uncharacterized membrane protein